MICEPATSVENLHVKNRSVLGLCFILFAVNEVFSREIMEWSNTSVRTAVKVVETPLLASLEAFVLGPQNGCRGVAKLVR